MYLKWGTCFTVSHVSAVLIYVRLSHRLLEESLFSYWTEIWSETTSNRVAKVKCLPFLWQLLSDLWCQHSLHKHLWISSSLRVCEWSHVWSHLPVAGYDTARHYTAAVYPDLFIAVFVRTKRIGWIAQLQLRSCIPWTIPIACNVIMPLLFVFQWCHRITEKTEGRDHTMICGGCIWIQCPTMLLWKL